MSTVRYAIGGDNIVGVKQAGNAVIPLSVQYSPEYIDTLDKIRNTPVVTGDGRSVPLGDVADVSVRKMPEMIRERQRQPRRLHLRRSAERDRPGLRGQARRRFSRQNLTLPTGYSVEWTGLYEYAAAARARLRLIVPLTLVIIFGLLVVAFRSVVGEHPHPAVGAVRDGRRRVPAVDARLPDDDGGHRRLHLAVRRRRADRHHHGHLHPRRRSITRDDRASRTSTR